jgi:hypothetical protein
MKYLIFIAIVFSSCSPTINIGSVKPPELSIVYPDPTYNNLLIIQE